MIPPGPLTLAPDAAQRARMALDQAGYAIEPLIAALGLKDVRHLARLPIQAVLDGLGDEGIEPLIKLFALGSEISSDVAERALPHGVSFWEEIGLVRTSGGSIKALLRLQPDEDFILASDWPATAEKDLQADHVLGHNPTAALLDNITIRAPVDTALDLGTGCGIQALLAAGHAKEVVATDINPRALNIATFNAHLNGAKIDFREGDLFEPVAGLTFDLITSNPPFVISPESTYLFRDSKLGGEGITRRITSTASEYLNEGGFCQLLCNWAHYEDSDWEAALRSALGGNDCDVWVIKLSEADAAVYATGWIRQQAGTPQSFEDELRRWLDFYEREGINRVSWTFVTMRKRSGQDNWFALTEVDLELEQRCGSHVKRCFEGYGVLATHDEEGLLALTPRVSAESRLEQSFAPEDGGWAPDSTRLSTADGLPISGGIDAHVANMLVRCDGATPLHAVFARAAEDAQVTYEAMLPECLKIARRLFEGGHLVVE